MWQNKLIAQLKLRKHPQPRRLPMLLLSATDLAIAVASKAGTLTVTNHTNERLGCEYWVIGDDAGLIEVALSEAEAAARISAVAASAS